MIEAVSPCDDLLKIEKNHDSAFDDLCHGEHIAELHHDA